MEQLEAVNVAFTDEERRNHSNTHTFVTADGGLTYQGELLVALAIEVLSKACFTNADAHGWYQWLGTDDNPKAELVQRNFGEVCMLFASEIAEAFEAFRDGDDPTEISYGPSKSTSPVADNEIAKPEGIASELADVLIRIFDTTYAMGIPLGEAIIRKHAYNFTRPYRHGGKLA